MDETNPLESTTMDPIPTEPVTLATEGNDPTLPYESVPETTFETIPETLGSGKDSALGTIYEELYGEPYEDPTEATEEVLLVDVVQRVGSDIVHASLFSGFLIAGTLVGIFILRNIYGS